MRWKGRAERKVPVQIYLEPELLDRIENMLINTPPESKITRSRLIELLIMLGLEKEEVEGRNPALV